MALTVPASLLGFIVKGDIDGVTIYTDRFGRKVVYKKAPPTKPPSQLQLFQRYRFSLALDYWRALTPAQKADYETASLRLCLCATGLNLFIHLAMKGRTEAWQTTKRQTALDLAFPRPV